MEDPKDADCTRIIEDWLMIKNWTNYTLDIGNFGRYAKSNRRRKKKKKKLLKYLLICLIGIFNNARFSCDQYVSGGQRCGSNVSILRPFSTYCMEP